MKKILLKIVFPFLVLLMSNFVLAQDGEYIIGKLLDAKTQEPVPFASIRIKDRALGIISNANGSFKIPLKYKEFGDIIEISAMGYQSMEILIQDFSVNELNYVKFMPAPLELEEVIVISKRKRRKRLSARRIVRKAIDAISKNYPSSPFSTVGYYRDYQLKDNTYFNLNEAIFEVFDSGFHKSDTETTKVRINDYKENTDFKRDSLALQPYDFRNRRKIIDNAFLPNYGGNEFTILRVHDAIRNYDINTFAFAYRFEHDFIEEHSLSRDTDVFFGNERLYVISVRKFHQGYRVIGKLYISRNDFAIHKMEYALYDKKQSNLDLKPDKNGSTDKLIFEVSTEYKRANGKMYLNYISLKNTFKIVAPPVFRIDTINAFKNRRYFEVKFNKKINEKTAEKSKNYVVLYRGKRIGLEKIIIGNSTVSLHPDRKQAGRFFAELDSIGRDDKVPTELLEFKIKSLEDEEGNVLNEPTSLEFLQFREFFVQRVYPTATIPNDDGSLMNNNTPIFKNQPIIRADNFDDYWMNTPLQKSEQ